MSIVTEYMRRFLIQPDAIVDLRRPSVNDRQNTRHKHVNIICEDGSELWLDIGGVNEDDFDHNFVDIRWMNPSGKMKGIGYFTIVNGMRGSQSAELPDTKGRVVKGKGYNGGYVATLLVDKNGVEQTAIKPSAGNG